MDMRNHRNGGVDRQNNLQPARIDQLVPGQAVTLKFGVRDSFTETVTFLGVEGAGDDRRASFRTEPPYGQSYEWQAYRFRNRWCFGSSAEPLSIVRDGDQS